MDQLHRIYKGQSGQHGLHLVRLPNGEALEEYPAYYEEVNEEPLDPEIYEIMAPSEEVLRRCEIYENLPAETLRLYDRLWTRLGV